VINAPSAVGKLMLELGVLPGQLLVLKVIWVKHILKPFLEAVNIAQRQKWLTVKRWMDFFSVIILYD